MDTAMAWELADEWLPDYIAYAENPLHPDAPALADRARQAIGEGYRANYEDDPEAEGWQVTAEDIAVFCFGVADFIVHNYDRKAAWGASNPMADKGMSVTP